MDNVSREQFKQLRQMGYTKDNIVDFAKRGRIAEKLNKETFAQKGLLRSAGEFLNMDEFGRGIGQTIYNMTGQGKRIQEGILQQNEEQTNSLIDALKQARESGDEKAVVNLTKEIQRRSQEDGVDFEQLATGGLNNREVLGSAASTALNIASLGGALNLGTKAATGATTVGRAALVGAGQGAVAGGAFGAAEALTEGEGIVPGAAKGAAMGAAVGGVLGGASKYIDDLVKTTPESKLFETKDSFKTLQRKFKEGAIYQGKGVDRKLISDPISTITKTGVGKQLKVVDGKINTEQARTQIRSLIDDFDDDVTNAITGSKVKASLASLKEEAVSMIRKNESLKASGKVKKTIIAIDSYFDDFAESYGDELSMESVSAIRKAMNKQWNPDTVDVERAVGDVMRKVIYKNVPGAQQTLVKEGELIAADKFLDALQGRAVKGGRLGSYFGNLVGAIAGQNATDSYVGSVVGALSGGQISRFMQRQQLDPLVPKVARGITSIIDQIPTDAAGNFSKTAVLNLIAQMSADGQEERQSPVQ